MRIANRNHFSLSRACAFSLCIALLVTSQPVALLTGLSFAQELNEGGLRRQTIPDYQLPDVAEVVNEGKKAKPTELPRPALKPSTDCGFRDDACREKKPKRKSGKISRRITRLRAAKSRCKHRPSRRKVKLLPKLTPAGGNVCARGSVR